MAADTAYLEGGPCAGTTHKITAAESDTGEIVCKGGLYKNPEKGQLHHGDIVFKYAGPAPTSGSSGSGSNPAQYAPHVYKAWSDLQRGTNRNVPSVLRRVEIAERRVLQRLAHRRRMR